MALGLVQLCLDGLWTLLQRINGPWSERQLGPLARLMLGPVALVLFPLLVSAGLVVRAMSSLMSRGANIGRVTIVVGAALLPLHGFAVFFGLWPGPPEKLIWVYFHAGLIGSGLLVGVLAAAQRVRFLAPISVAVGGLLCACLAPVWMPARALVWLGRTLIAESLVRPDLERLERMPTVRAVLLLLLPLFGAVVGAWALLRMVQRSWTGATNGDLLWVLLLVATFILLPAFLLFAVRGRREGGRFETVVGLRYLAGRQGAGFAAAITLISVLGVTLGVCSLDVVLSVMRGFEIDMREKILGTKAHLLVTSYEGPVTDWDEVLSRVQSVDGVVGATPYVFSELMIKGAAGAAGAVYKGVDAETVGRATDLLTMIETGPNGAITSTAQAQNLLDTLDQPVPYDAKKHLRESDAALPGILLGRELADHIRVRVGDRVFAVSPMSKPGPMGTMMATMQPYRVVGLVHTGMYEFDSTLAWVSLASAQDFLEKGAAVDGIEIRVNDIFGAATIGRVVTTELGYPYWVRDWMQMNRSLFSALRLERLVMGIILTFIIIVAALNIIIALIMAVLEKKGEIAILKALGATGQRILRIFVIEGLVVGFIGTVVGSGLGYLLCWLLEKYRFIPLESDVYYVDRLPVEMEAGTFASVALVAIGISFLATLFPAWKAATLDPIDGLRYE